MSIVKVINHNEVIYNILYKAPPPKPKSPRYESENERILKRQKINKTHATMGFADIELNGTDNFLKKGEGIQPPPKEKQKRCLTSKTLPAVPKVSEMGKRPEKPNINFRVVNIKKTIHTTPKNPEPYIVDTYHGDKYNVNELKLKCVYNKKYGKVPNYLRKQNYEIQKAEKEYHEALVTKEPLCKPISTEEREDLLNGLKHNWAELQKGYLLLPILTDTIPKVLKKKKIEDQLKQLEKDIKVIECNPYIYIHD